MRKFFIEKEGFIYIAGCLLFTAFLFVLYKPVSVIGLGLTVFITFFFRDPHRRYSQDVTHIISPADGKVMAITPLVENDFMKCEAIKVTIFLSLFNVHINRSPIAGTVKYVKYRPGKFLPAFKGHASEINERNAIGIEGEGIKIIVHQITGFIARRIVCRVKEGDVLEKGERFGLIKFGSCTEIIVPSNVEIKVKPGDKVKGASTIIGVMK
ncbi:phosphatidylserine decarboxylase family protein [Cellulosilyticum sp. I15G10I2]|uniref:phosphatidylserine decarboxylase family protein n=1 Tax=Cellulosilyticum sp. I15G10I2 TaxID=1892843 RepID=UPI00085BFD4E|nr:phosphatidylserine decarboxylase family protein [Cellulosilyticum sp. I15G10I2]